MIHCPPNSAFGLLPIIPSLDGLSWLVFLWLWAFVAIAAHESAHGLTAKLVGFRPLQMVVGSGRAIMRTEFGDMRFVLRWIPLGGRMISNWDSPRGLRWKGALFAAAGPACDALLLFLLWRVLGAIDVGGMPGWFLNLGGGTVALLLIFQVLLLLNNLFPQRVISDGWATRSDGLMVWEFLTGGISAAAGATGENYREHIRRYDTAFNRPGLWFEESSPEMRDAYVRLTIASAEGDHKAAIANGRKVLREARMADGERAAILDQMASVVAVAGELAFLKEALRWAKEAVDLCPDASTLRGTLGGLLVLDGQWVEGLQLLLPLTDEALDLIDRSISYAFIALAYQRMGRTQQAADALAMSMRLGQSHGVAAWVGELIRLENRRRPQSG